MTQQQAHPTDAVLGEFQLGKLSDLEHADIETHLAECPDCQGRVAAIRIDDTLTGLLAGRAEPAVAVGSAPNAAASADTQGWDKSAATVTGPPATPDSLAGHPKYQTVRQLGVGGMGSVWLAQHALMNREVAVKVIRPELLAKQGAAERFLREVRAAARLHHVNIVTAFDAEPAGDSCLLVMEYVDGQTLADGISSGPLPIAEACRAARDAARGLAHAHAAGLVHRDVKPHNLIRAADGTTKVLDFGLAGVGGGELTAAGADGLSGAGMIFGTPDYIAPEQIDDPHAADARADIYGLGCTLYHLLAGRPPFPTGTMADKLDGHRQRQPAPIPGLPTGVAAVLAKMMAKRPEDRYQTAEAAANALEPFSQNVPAKPRQRWLVAAALLFAGIMTVAGVVYRIQTDNGEVVITPIDEDVQILLLKGGKEVEVIDTKTKKRVRVPTGSYDVKIRGELPDGLEVRTDRIVVSRGKEALVVIERVKKGDAGAARASPKSDEVLILGSWRLVAAEAAGKPIPPELVAAIRPTLTFTEDKLIARSTGTLPREFLAMAAALDVLPRQTVTVLTEGAEGVYKLGPAKSPKTIDISYVAPSQKIGVGIYSLDGDRLKLCLSVKPDRVADRPTEFVTRPGVMNILITFERVRPDKGGEVRELTWPGGKQVVFYTAFSPDGRYLLAGSSLSAQTTAVWETATGRLVTTITAAAGAVFMPDSRHILGSGQDDQLIVWDPVADKEVRRFMQHRSSSWPSLSADGTRAISHGGEEGDPMVLWDVPTGKPIAEVQTGHDGTFFACLSPDGQRIVSAGVKDRTVRLWDVAQKKVIKSWASKDRPVAGRIVFGRDSRSFVIAAEQAPGGHIARFDEQADSPTWLRDSWWDGASGISHDGRFAMLFDGKTTVRCRDLDTGREVGHAALPTDVWGTIAVSPDGRTGAATGPRSGDIRGAPRIYLFRPGEPPPPEEAGEVRRFEGHAGGIIGISYAPDGRHVLTTSYDKSVRLWYVQTGKEVRRFEGHTAWPYAAVLTPDGRYVLSGGDDLVLRIWDAQTGQQIRDCPGHARGITCIAVSPDGSHALTASWDGTIRLWKVPAGEQERVFEGHSEIVQSVAFSPDGKQALSAGLDKTVRLWDLESGKELHRLEGHTDQVLSAVFSPDGRHVLSGSADRTLRLWNLETGKQVRCFEGHTSPVYQVAFSLDGCRAISAATTPGEDNGERGLRMWDVETGTELQRLDTGAGSRMAVSPDRRYALVSRTNHPDARLWRLPDAPPPNAPGEVRRFIGHKDAVHSVAFSPNGRLAASGSGLQYVSNDRWQVGAQDYTIRLWDVASGRELHCLKGHNLEVHCVAFSPDGRLLASASHDMTVRLWDVETGKNLQCLQGHIGCARAVAFSPDGLSLLSGGIDRVLILWDVKSGKEIRRFEEDQAAVDVVAFTPNGRQVVSAGGDDTVRVWDVGTGKRVREWGGHSERVTHLTVSSDGRRVVTASPDQTLRLWDIDTGKELVIFRGHVNMVRAVALSSDGRQAVSASFDQTVRLWDVETGKELYSFKGHEAPVISVAFSPDGKYVLSGSADTTVRLWHLPEPPLPK
jgi:uncharacterized protein (TIGR03067 family)